VRGRARVAVAANSSQRSPATRRGGPAARGKGLEHITREAFANREAGDGKRKVPPNDPSGATTMIRINYFGGKKERELVRAHWKNRDYRPAAVKNPRKNSTGSCGIGGKGARNKRKGVCTGLGPEIPLLAGKLDCKALDALHGPHEEKKQKDH